MSIAVLNEFRIFQITFILIVGLRMWSELYFILAFLIFFET